MGLVIALDSAEDNLTLIVEGDPLLPPLAEPGDTLEVKLGLFASESGAVELRRQDHSLLWVKYEGTYYPEVVTELDLPVVFSFDAVCDATDQDGCHEAVSELDVLATAAGEERRVPVRSSVELPVEGSVHVLSVTFAREYGAVSCSDAEQPGPGTLLNAQLLAEEFFE
ncbi:MAG: hypothetical protein JW751_32010 [Polyangiaceae bacterium]|nr:hypothetical protein [Polyangiaceae bacterium]